MSVERAVIAIAPVGEVPEQLLLGLIPAVEARFPGRAVRLIPGLAHPDEAYHIGRDQYLTDPILGALTGLDDKAERLLGVADLHLFTFRLDFVIGVASKEGRVALVALSRLRPEFRGGQPDPQLLLERAAKEAIHELGHTYGLEHCENPVCVMYLSSAQEETDQKSDSFCAEHERQLNAVLDLGDQGNVRA